MADQTELAAATSRVSWLLGDLEELVEQFASKIRELERIVAMEDKDGINKT